LLHLLMIFQGGITLNIGIIFSKHHICSAIFHCRL